jgi:hypothetical protein
MKSFDFYEFTGVLVPGAITLVAVLLIYPHMRTTLFSSDLTVGDLGLFVVLAYAAGHLTQAVGNGVEWLWWRAWGGMPNDWVRSQKHSLIADAQRQALQTRLSSKLGLQTSIDPAMSAGAWRSITRQIYAEVAAQSRAGRVDIFNGNYGLNRGIASALLIGLVLLLFAHGLMYWQIALVVLVSAGVALYRMHRFGAHYAKELFVQFLPLPSGSGSAAATIAQSVPATPQPTPVNPPAAQTNTGSNP